MGLLPKIPSSPGMPPEAGGPILPSSGMPRLPGQSSPGQPPQTPGLPPPPLTSYRFQEKADYEKGFAVYYDEKIRPVIRELEQIRAQKIEKIAKNKPKAIITVVAILAVGLGLSIRFNHAGWVVFAVMLCAGVWMVAVNGPKKELESLFKEKVIPLVIRFFGPYDYAKDGKIDATILDNSKIFEFFNRYDSEDYITGKHRDTQFAFAEVDLAHHSGGGRHSSTHGVFRGMLILLEMKRPCTGMTVVKRESQKGLWARLTGKSDGLKSVNFENPEFEKIFEVYSSDENETKSLVTPDFIQRLMKLDEVYKSQSVRCCFFGDKLLLAISHSQGGLVGNLFEAGVSKNMSINLDDLHAYLAQFKGILDIIDTVIPPRAGVGME